MFNTLVQEATVAIEKTTEAVSAVSEEIVETVGETSGGLRNLSFSAENLVEALLDSAAGMVGIFLVVGIIIASVTILNKLGSKKD